ncbi:unnamed protein product [Sympodiomycopsis kandeliae]
MGASESRQLTDNDAAPKQGYHVVRVAANSPAHLAGIEPFFDFCVGLDGVALTFNENFEAKEDGGAGMEDALGVRKKLEEREGTEVVLNVWSSKRQELRDIPLVPSRSWSTSSSSDSSSQPSLLGLTLRPCAPHLALSSVWHILDILENSPAESAGLVPFGDYIIGWSNGILKHEGDFYELVESHQGRPLRLYVYNSDYDHTREIIIVPNREWGGEGLLGCGVGFGLLHRIPRPQDRTNVPQQGNEEYDDESQQSFPSNPQQQSAMTRSSTDPNLGPNRNQYSHHHGKEPASISSGKDEDEDEEEEDEDELGHTSGVTISQRRDEDEDD